MTGTIGNGCPYCGTHWHSGMCPRIQSIEYHPNGAVKKITLRDPDPLVTQVTVPAVIIDVFPKLDGTTPTCLTTS